VKPGLEAADLAQRQRQKSKNSVRSVSVASEIIFPFASGLVFA
jgi:hypothetical protein